VCRRPGGGEYLELTLDAGCQKFWCQMKTKSSSRRKSYSESEFAESNARPRADKSELQLHKDVLTGNQETENGKLKAGGCKVRSAVMRMQSDSKYNRIKISSSTPRHHGLALEPIELLVFTKSRFHLLLLGRAVQTLDRSRRFVVCVALRMITVSDMIPRPFPLHSRSDSEV
jgi:hypothetical protein